MYAVSGATTHIYETLISDAPSHVPNFSSMVTNSHPNVIPHYPAHNVSPAPQSLNVPPGVVQWILAGPGQQTTDPSSPFFRTFLMGKPLALGILLIVSSILQIGLGVALFFTWSQLSVYSGVTFWGSLFYIIAGALTISAQTTPNICLVKGSLSLNIISSIVSVIAVILYSVDMAINQCYYYPNNSNYSKCWEQQIPVFICDGILIFINLLVFCVTLSASIFGCRSLSNVPSGVTQVFVVQNEGAALRNPSSVPPSFPLPQKPIYSSPYINAI